MSPVLTYFLTWLMQFAVASALLLMLVHLAARHWRKRRAVPAAARTSTPGPMQRAR